MFVGIDIGGTNCRVAGATSLENPLSFDKKEFLLGKDFDEDFSLLIKTIQALSPNKIEAVGLGTTGKLSENKTMLVSARNLPHWVNKPIASLLENTCNCPLTINNDIVAAGLGEYYFGNGKNENFYYVGWGTGLGGAKVIGGTHPSSEKLDWGEYFEDWEKDCGGNKIQENYGKKAEHLSEDEWKKVMEQFKKHLEEFREKTDAKKIIFGGGISLKQSERLEKLFPLFPVSLKISSLGEDAGLFGAFALIKNSLYYLL